MILRWQLCDAPSLSCGRSHHLDAHAEGNYATLKIIFEDKIAREGAKQVEDIERLANFSRFIIRDTTR